MPPLHHGASGSLGPVVVTAMLTFIALGYLRGWVSLRANFSIPVWRASGFFVGLFLIWLAVGSPLSALDHELLTVHMLKHLLLMTIAPPLIWLGEPVRCAAWAFPPAMWRRRTSALHRIGTLARPEVCWLAAAAALIGWHIPTVFTLAMQSRVWHFAEQSSFLVAGLLFWWPVVQPWPNAAKSELSMILYLFFATIPCDILSGFLVFCDRVVYSVYSSSSRPLELSALADQQCAAALMWTCVTLIYLVAGAILTMRLLSPQRPLKAKSMTPALRINAAPSNVQQSLEAF